MTKFEFEAQSEIQKSHTDRIHNEFLDAAANEDWERVINLYDENTFLSLKSSNSTWYRKARLCVKSQSRKGSDVDTSAPQKTPYVSTELQSPMVKKWTKKKRKFGPSRPSLATRPKINPNDSHTSESTRNITIQPPNHESSQRSEQNDLKDKDSKALVTLKKKHVKEKINNKPKR